MDEEDKDSSSYDDDATKSDVCDEENLKMNIEAEGTENSHFTERWVCNRSFRFIEVLQKHAIGIHQTLNFCKLKPKGLRIYAQKKYSSRVMIDK